MVEKFISIYVSGNVELVGAALGGTCTGRVLSKMSGKAARAIVHKIFEWIGVVEPFSWLDAGMTSCKGNPANSKIVQDYIDTLGRRDRAHGKVIHRALEIFSVTFAMFEVRLCKLSVPCFTELLQTLTTSLQADGSGESALLLSAFSTLTKKMVYPWMIAACAYISRVEGLRGNVYPLKVFELPALGTYGIRDFVQAALHPQSPPALPSPADEWWRPSMHTHTPTRGVCRSPRATKAGPTQMRSSSSRTLALGRYAWTVTRPSLPTPSSRTRMCAPPLATAPPCPHGQPMPSNHGVSPRPWFRGS